MLKWSVRRGGEPTLGRDYTPCEKRKGEGTIRRLGQRGIAKKARRPASSDKKSGEKLDLSWHRNDLIEEYYLRGEKAPF